MTLAIETTDLVKNYEVGLLRKRTVRALQGANLKVEEGQIFGLLGPNGAGKSTIIKLILTLLHPSSGTVRVFGRPPSDTEARRLIGYLPENPAPYEYLTGLEFVTFAGRLAGLSGAPLHQRVAEVVAITGMGQAASLQIRRYSKGMTQRICLAQALVSQPRLLVLDEPTSGLDVLGRQLVREIILQQRALGTTVLLCSHIIPDVEALCAQVAVIVGGQIIQQGSVSTLIATDDTGVEVLVERIDEATARALVKDPTRTGDRWVLRCGENELPQVLRQLLDRNARIVGVQRNRYSLEDVFLKTVHQSGRRVGSDIS